MRCSRAELTREVPGTILYRLTIDFSLRHAEFGQNMVLTTLLDVFTLVGVLT